MPDATTPVVMVPVTAPNKTSLVLQLDAADTVAYSVRMAQACAATLARMDELIRQLWVGKRRSRAALRQVDAWRTNGGDGRALRMGAWRR
jgi:hypothetical protein